MKRWFIFFTAGGLFGAVGDYFHKVSGTTIYPSQLNFHQIPGLPVWTTLLFGLAGVALGLGYQWFKKFRPEVKYRKRSNYPHALVGGFLFLGIYGLSALIGQWAAPFPDLSLAAITLVFWVIFDGTLGGLLFGFAVGVVGTAVEITLVHFGFFFYGEHIYKLLGVASWLPWLYVSAAVAAADFSGLLFPRKPRARGGSARRRAA